MQPSDGQIEQPNVQYNYGQTDENSRTINPLLSDDDDDDDDDEEESSSATASFSNSDHESLVRHLLASLDGIVNRDRIPNIGVTDNHLGANIMSSDVVTPNIVSAPSFSQDTKVAAESTRQPPRGNKQISLPPKIQVRFQSIGSTIQIEPSVYKITSTNQFFLVVQFLAKRLKKQQENTQPTVSESAKSSSNEIITQLLLPQSSIFCYIHNSFSPSNDEILSNLFANFAVNQELVVSYCENIAFG